MCVRARVYIYIYIYIYYWTIKEAIESAINKRGWVNKYTNEQVNKFKKIKKKKVDISNVHR